MKYLSRKIGAATIAMTWLAIGTIAAGPDSTQAPLTATPQPFDMGWMLAKTVFSLVLIIALIFGLVFLVKRFFGKQLPGAVNREWFQIIAKIPLQPRQSLWLVKVVDRILLLGVTESGISMLTEFEQSAELRQVIAGLENSRRFSDSGFLQLLKKQMDRH